MRIHRVLLCSWILTTFSLLGCGGEPETPPADAPATASPEASQGPGPTKPDAKPASSDATAPFP